MIKWRDIKVKHKKDGVYLSAETNKGSYGQFYNTHCSNKRSFAWNSDEAKSKFLKFYNKFE